MGCGNRLEVVGCWEGLRTVETVQHEDRPMDVSARLRAIPPALITGATFATPLVFSPQTYECGAIKVVVYQLAIIAALVFWLSGELVRGSLRLPERRTLALLGAYILANGLSFLLSAYKHESGAELWRVSVLVTLCLLTSVSFRTRRHRMWLFYAICFSSLLIGIHSLVQKSGHDLVKWSFDPSIRVIATIGNPNMLAGFCVVVLPVLALVPVAMKSWWMRAISWTSALLMLLALYFTLSRGGVLGLLGSAVILGIALRKQLLSSRSRRLVAAVVLVGVFLLGAIFAKPLVVRFKELSKFDTTVVGSQNVRLAIWLGATRAALEHPVFGTGAGTFDIYFPKYREPDFEKAGVTNNTQHAHCEYLEILAETGLVGLAAFVAPVVLILILGWRRLKAIEGSDRYLLMGLMAGIFGLLVHNLVSVNLRFSTTPYFLWLSLGVMLAYENESSGITVSLPPWTRRKSVMIPVAVSMLAIFCYAANALVITPYRSEVAYLRGKKFADRGIWMRAIQEATETVRLAPDHKRAHYLLGSAYFELKSYDEAVKAYRRLQRYSPHFGQVNYNIAACYINQSQWEKAAEEYAIQKRLGGLPKGENFEALLEALRMGGMDDQRRYPEVLRRLLAINPEDHIAHNKLGVEYFEDRAFLKALEHYELALEIEPGYTPALNNLAGIHFVNQEYAKARDVCLAIVRIQPEKTVAWVNLGKAHYMLKERDEAFMAWRKALEIEPSNEEAKRYLTRPK